VSGQLPAWTLLKSFTLRDDSDRAARCFTLPGFILVASNVWAGAVLRHRSTHRVRLADRLSDRTPALIESRLSSTEAAVDVS
jgi:hypothetical protein